MSSSDQYCSEGAEELAELETWLGAHPDFLARWLDLHPEALHCLVPPARRTDDNVLDLQRALIERLQSEIQRLKERQRQLIAATRSNLSSQEQVHRAALMLLEAQSFEDFIHIVTADLPVLLGLEAVSLCAEAAGEPLPDMSTLGVYALPPGAVDRLLGPDEDLALASEIIGARTIFGPRAPFVHSQALIRLRISRAAPAGLLALGSREAHMFHAEQGTELLLFFAGVMERCIRHWLDLP